MVYEYCRRCRLQCRDMIHPRQWEPPHRLMIHRENGSYRTGWGSGRRWGYMYPSWKNKTVQMCIRGRAGDAGRWRRGHVWEEGGMEGGRHGRREGEGGTNGWRKRQTDGWTKTVYSKQECSYVVFYMIYLQMAETVHNLCTNVHVAELICHVWNKAFNSIQHYIRIMVLGVSRIESSHKILMLVRIQRQTCISPAVHWSLQMAQLRAVWVPTKYNK